MHDEAFPEHLSAEEAKTVGAFQASLPLFADSLLPTPR